MQGDILFPLSYYKEISSKHWRTETLVSFENQTNIRVKIDNSIPPTSQWRTAINQAITNWNNIPDCRLNFSLVTSGQFDILIKSDDGVLEDYLCSCSWIPYPYYLPVAAAGTFPVGGKPGSEILINLDVEDFDAGPLSLAQKTYNISHNIGHCMGFLHTDAHVHEGVWYNDVFIPGTSFNDEFSIMNSQDLWRDWSFSQMDVFAIQYLYGVGRRVCLRTSNGHYVQALNGGGGNVVASSTNPYAWETFHLMESPLYGHPYYVLQARNGNYLQAANGGGGNVVANSPNPWDWETFELIPGQEKGTYFFRTKTTGHFLQAENGGGGNLNATSNNPWAWESFVLINSHF
ncbi:MAG: hypothetical protein K0B09_07260 [Bacteroidales bacterium]|nr:hypothetical protein [Bacteroidales bacterium]